MMKMVGISEKNLSFKVVFEQIQKKGFAKLMLCGLTAKMKEYFEQNAPVMGLVCSVEDNYMLFKKNSNGRVFH